ncbi:MAG: A/G-specific adenine glycosylase [Saprospiraceae bacterium]|nr:A/G-specific adenine glycosylase [Saprospiraceae bacterium]
MLSYKITEKKIKLFQQGIYQWSSAHPRAMPWKGIKDPYKIWISEIILQQTRVEQGWPYYQKFILHFPDVNSLASAPIEKILRLWQGLGYYTRARNLHASATWIVQINSGNFPDSFEAIKRLKGVGDYTASAIASFAFDLPHAVLDGNVHRILSRYFGIKETIQSSGQKKSFQNLADQLLDKTSPALYNQAIMDFGALCCTPKNPACNVCPLQNTCVVLQKNQVQQFPPTKKNAVKKIRHFHFFIVIDSKRKVLIRRRSKKDIWNGLYEFPMLEAVSSRKPGTAALKKIFSKPVSPGRPLLIHKQTLSHQIVNGYFYLLKERNLHLDSVSVPINKLNDYPFPGIIAKNLKTLMTAISKFR